MSSQLQAAALLLLACAAYLIAGCAGRQAATNPVPDPVTSPSAVDWLQQLPEDALQPWELLNEQGAAASVSTRTAAAINTDSEFAAGVERHLESGDVADNGEASSILSTQGSFSYAMYRIPLEGGDPGVITVDANLLSGDGYYVGLADYGSGSWKWHGSFSDNHVRLATAMPGADYTSPLGSVFVCVVVYDGAGCDVVGVGVNPVDPGDDSAPPAVEGLTATATDGGVLLEWFPVAAGDLAGYRVYHGSQWFFDGLGTGVQVVESLEGLTSHILTGLTGERYIRIGAVDISGNESLSDIISAEPLPGTASSISVAVSAPSGAMGEVITLTASGAEFYDFDTDGDGFYDITGDSSGVAGVETTSLGIIRARVRGTSDGTSVANGGVSVVISGNSRPVASASAVPTAGEAPLTVSFSGAESADFDGEIVGGGWDFDGDGTYDLWDDASTTYVTGAEYEYTEPGVYNAKLRVVDDKGAWDVDTLGVLVSPTAPPAPWFHTLGHPDSSLTEDFDSIALTEDDSIVLSGTAYAGATGYDASVCKFDSAGNLLWSSWFGGPSNKNEGAWSVCLDSGGNSYVAGYTHSFGEGGRNCLLLKLDSAGELVWARMWGGELHDYASAVSCTAEDQIIVSGYTQSYGHYGYDDVFTMMVDPSGQLVWDRIWGFSGSYEFTTDMEIDESGFIYVTGITQDIAGNDIFLVKWASDGGLEWDRIWYTELDEYADCLVISGGEIIIGGKVEYVGFGLENSLMLRFDTLGNIVRESALVTSANSEILGLAVHAVYGIAVGGRYSNAPDFDGLLALINPVGAIEWSRSVGDENFAAINDVAFNSHGQLIAVGSTTNASVPWANLDVDQEPATGTTEAANGVVILPDFELAKPSLTVTDPEWTWDIGAGGRDAAVCIFNP